MKRYTNVEQWRADMELFSRNVNDKDLMEAIVSRYHNSAPEIQEQIKTEMMVSEEKADGVSLESLKKVVQSQTDSILIIKSKNDLWFEC